MAAAATSMVEVESLSRRFGDREALRGVDLQVASGEIFALLGPNGGGKTTLFRILSTILPPSGGRATVAGHDVVRDSSAIRRRLGVLFQSPSLDAQLTVSENLRHHGHLFGMRGASLSGRMDEVLAQVGLKDRASERVSRLSGGLRRRAELAKAMLPRPEVLLLDEPSTGLDPAARRDLRRSLELLRRETGVTVLLTTHLMDEAEAADRIAILDAGKVVVEGRPTELKHAVGGDVIEVRGPDPEDLCREIRSRYGDGVTLVDSTVHVERRGGQELLAEMLPALGRRIQSVMLREPTLEDVFLSRTGHQFHDPSEETES